MSFIKLNLERGGMVVINTNNITYLENASTFSTAIYLIDGPREYIEEEEGLDFPLGIVVTESMEEVLEMIREEKGLKYQDL